MFTPLLLALSFYLFNFSSPKILGAYTSISPISSKIYASLPQNLGVVASTVRLEKSAPIIIERYLSRYHSPLLPYKDLIVEAAERNNIDPLLIVAIAQQESNLGKKSPDECYNAWGWGIHARGTKCFSNWEEAIESVTAGISKSYCRKGYCDDLCIMMQKYTPGSNGSWCFGVKQFLNEMETGDF